MEIIVLISILFMSGLTVMRAYDVAEFRNKILEMCFHYDADAISWDISSLAAVYDSLPSYNEMLWSFRPLKLSEWLTQEQINLLTGAE